MGYPLLPFTTGAVLSSDRDHIAVVIPASRDRFGTRSLVLARAHRPGYSGGPVFLESGLVVGVVSIGRMLDDTLDVTSCVACTHVRDAMRRHRA